MASQFIIDFGFFSTIFSLSGKTTLNLVTLLTALKVAAWHHNAFMGHCNPNFTVFALVLFAVLPTHCHFALI
jgi:hypothetical protein